MKETRDFPAKLLLFGEFTVLNGSRALAVPLSLWHGVLKSGGLHADPDLLKFSVFLNEKELFSPAERDTFQNAVKNGLYFDSTIPCGYGLGSSGALCAAVYTYFFDQGCSDITEIKHHLASMEAHFHGTSSGMDPLISLLNAPVLREHNTYHILQQLRWPSHLQVFLLDSGIPRATGNLVDQYIQWSTREEYRLECIRPLVQSVDHAISFFLEGYMPGFWEHLRLISMLQLRYFTPMIPEGVFALWQSLTGHPEIALKLCGAGGGGYYLVFAKSETDVMAVLGNTMKIIPVSSSGTQ